MANFNLYIEQLDYNPIIDLIKENGEQRILKNGNILCDNTKHPDMLHGLKVEYFIIRVLEMMVVNTL